jgi:hypothetical protein
MLRRSQKIARIIALLVFLIGISFVAYGLIPNPINKNVIPVTPTYLVQPAALP